VVGTDVGLAGSIPQWGAFVALVGILARQVVPWRKLTIESGQALRKELLDRIDELKGDHRDCQEKLNLLQQKITGMQRQHVQEQISLINAIIRSVDAPQLKAMLGTLESVQIALRAEGVSGDDFEGA
jgi:hypothetical protein